MRLWVKNLILCFLCFGFCTLHAAHHKEQFSSAEHLFIGDELYLRLNLNEPEQKGLLLHLPNKLQLSYGEILALGDFYGPKPIASGPSLAEQRTRFMAAFNAFAHDEQAHEEVLNILQIVHKEQRFVFKKLQKNHSETDIYDKASSRFERQYNCATGGHCSKSTWWLYPGRYFWLKTINFDHFGDDSLLTYTIGHTLAVETAIKAHETGNISLLEEAYAMNAFASHFLSDRFSSGHLRAPRKALHQKVIPSILGDLLVQTMHDEECRYGLHVHDQWGNHWVAYGDDAYFNKQAAIHRHQQKKALQHSLDAIFFAYLTGVAMDDDAQQMAQFIPYPDEQNNQSNQDVAALFYWDESSKKLMRRVDVNNPFDAHWTSNWSGWHTLLEFNKKIANETIKAMLNIKNPIASCNPDH